MPYRYLDDIAIADAAFEARGSSPEELFAAAADALLNVMLDDPAALGRVEELAVDLIEDDLELLLFSFLNELLFFKDARRLLLRVSSLAIGRRDGQCTLQGILYGERADRFGQLLNTDVKAVTLHRFEVLERDGLWRATVVLDV